MNRYTEEPDTKGAALIILICFVGLFALTVFSGWAYFKEPQEVIVEQISEEGVAKSHMIRELTGIEFPPEIAKWANITFSGTTVSIETHSINMWDGKEWK